MYPSAAYDSLGVPQEISDSLPIPASGVVGEVHGEEHAQLKDERNVACHLAHILSSQRLILL